MGGSAHTLGVLEGKKKSKSKCLDDKGVDSHRGPACPSYGCGEKNSHCRETWTEDTSRVIKEDVSKGPEFWFQVL